ncbi:MAG: hypothetical protein IRZ08_15230 [Frankia sp.]|nr:hypothetical protein [Frankia sp.]
MTIETTSTPTAAGGPADQGGATSTTTAASGAAGVSRADQFRAEIATLRIRDPRARTELVLLRLGAALLVVGPLVSLIAYFVSHSTTNPLQQRDAIVIALIGVAVTIGGAAVFVRYSMAAFLRFWLARLLFDRQRPGA